MPPLPLSRPDIGALESAYVQDVLNSDRLALGPYLRRFEALVAARCQARHAVAVSSGTAALHLILRGLGLGEGDEIVTTPFSFVASANVVLYVKARPRFVDIAPATYLMDPARLADALTPTTRAILAVDVFGLPVDWPALTDLARTRDLRLIDDACEALGGGVGDRPLGAWGDAAAFGFYPNKQITTGEGGCLTTNADDLAALCRSLRNQGRASDDRLEHVHLGYNYRMSELSAAVGCAQMERLSELTARRGEVAAWYRAALEPLAQDLVLPPEPTPPATRSWFVYVVRLQDHYTAEARDVLLHRLKEQGIGCAPYFPSIHLQPYYRRRFGFKPGDFPACEAVAARTLALPFYTALARQDVARVADAIRAALPTLPRLKRPVPFNG